MTNATPTTTENTSDSPNIKSEKGARERLAQLAPVVAKALGWKLQPTKKSEDDLPGVLPMRYEIKGPDDQSVSLLVGWPWKGKLGISGNFPNYVDGRQRWTPRHNQTWPAIACSLAKSGEQIARDITRRLFPEYLPMLKECKDYIAASLSDRDARKAAAEKLAKVIGARVEFYPNDSEEPRINVYRSSKLPEAAMDLKVYAEDVNFERLRVSHDEAAEILALLVKLRGKGGK